MRRSRTGLVGAIASMLVAVAVGTASPAMAAENGSTGFHFADSTSDESGPPDPEPSVPDPATQPARVAAPPTAPVAPVITAPAAPVITPPAAPAAPGDLTPRADLASPADLTPRPARATQGDLTPRAEPDTPAVRATAAHAAPDGPSPAAARSDDLAAPPAPAAGLGADMPATGPAGAATVTTPTNTAALGVPDPGYGWAAVDFAASLPALSDVDGNLAPVLDSAALALALLALLAIPIGIVNRTARNNADRIARALARSRASAAAGRSRRLPLAVAAAGTALVYAALQPEFGHDISSFALVLGLAAAFVVVTAAAEIPRRPRPERVDVLSGQVRRFPGLLLVGLACVLTSRLVGLQPGLILGALITFATTSALPSDLSGKAKAVSAASLATVGALAWILREPLVGMAGEEGVFTAHVVAAGLTAVTVASIETLAFAMIPIAFLDGAAVLAWSKPAWAVLAGIGIFGFVHVMLQPVIGAEEFVGRDTFLLGLLGCSLLAATAFWAWFRFRAPAPAPATSAAAG